MSKKMIFHIPAKIDMNYPSGSQIRPLRMIEAFKNIGYDVDVVMGYGKERKNQIDKIKENIKNGVKYDFLYAENSTSPSLLTEKNHLPLYPLMDFRFMQFCKKNNIKIGLFYRDIYWNFRIFMKNLPIWKRFLLYCFHKYDIYWYKKMLDILYLPSIEMIKYMPDKFKCKIEPLPPAIDYHNKKYINDEFGCDKNKKISIFYVGGIGEFYNLKLFCKIVSKFKNLEFVLCCRKNEWESVKNEYLEYMKTNHNIKIIHESGENLKKYYQNADIACLFLKPYVYLNFAIPIKLFEYLSYKKPIISTANTENGRFIYKNKVGWAIEYSEKALFKFFEELNGEQIKKMYENIEKIYDINTWEARAKTVANNLG